MRKRKKPPLPLKTTSFRLPLDVHAYLKAKAKEEDRPISYILIRVLNLWRHYETEQAKQPKVPQS